MTNNLFIITGGPGSGKSSLIDVLAAEGFAHMPEEGRAIIQDQVAIGGNALPWGDRALYAELILGWEMRSYREARILSGPVIFDRGIPDVLGYLTLCDLPVPAYVRKAVELYRYNRRVFIAPHWPAIFTQDAERKQSLSEAEATHNAMTEVYENLGYDLIPLPLVTIAERVRFVREQIAKELRIPDN